MDETLGQHAASLLVKAVSLKWLPFAQERVSLWQPVLALAYDAVIEGDPDRKVHVPSSIGDTGGFDVTASELLQNFDHWLGKGIVWSSLDFVTDWVDEL